MTGSDAVFRVEDLETTLANEVDETEEDHAEAARLRREENTEREAWIGRVAPPRPTRSEPPISTCGSRPWAEARAAWC